ncbi:MAG TPA: sigma-54 dependent transcriptional regulator [Bacillota bacterium]|nr:sigma-54 dependent transcriptional regulator [Bacillota bacterium]
MAATTLIIDDEESMRWILAKALEKEGYNTLTAATGGEGLAKFNANSPDLVLLDLRLPDMDGVEVLKAVKKEQPQVPVIMITAHGTVETAIEAMKAGAGDYISKPFDMEELKLIIRRSLEVVELVSEVNFLRGELGERLKQGLIGRSKLITEVRQMIDKITDTSVTVLIEGESGTGKEVVARQIHHKSAQANKPFVAINCAAIPENLLETELFGYERGAFTGATARKKGKLEVVGSGTLFLDEIGDMSPLLQAKILRVLQEKVFERVGGNEQLRLEARIIAATNRDLKKAVQEGTFREDLYYRLQVFPLRVPALRERTEDIRELAEFFLEKFDYRKKIKGFTEPALEMLYNYQWPGNVRELENAVERAVILCSEEYVTPQYLPGELRQREGTNGQSDSRSVPEKSSVFVWEFPEEGVSLEEVEKFLINIALERSGGNQTKAARLLGITRSALIYRMEKHNL